MGRPSKYTDDMPERVIELMSEGASLVEVAADLGICKDTLFTWRDDPTKQAFSDSIKRGAELSKAWWMREGREALRDSKFNHGLWYMNMKNRFRWSDRQQHEHTGADGGPIQSEQKVDLSKLGKDELRSLVAIIAKAERSEV